MNHSPLLRTLGMTALLICGSALQAQTVYRIVSPDGKVTFSDKPPATTGQGKVETTGSAATGSAQNSQLPYELRQVSARFPVTLYTTAGCAPCASGRSMLMNRGIPFTERTISGPEDTAALQRLAGGTMLPLLTIGNQRIKGYTDAEWTQYLDAAGYPKSSALPASYRNGASSPLVAVQAAPAAEAVPEQAPAPAPRPAAAPVEPPPPPNPAGIRF